MRLRTNSANGFSLIEILLVLVLISIIVAIAVPNLIAASRVAREARGVAHIKTLSNAQALYYGSHNKFGIIDNLFKDNYLADGQFVRHVNNTSGPAEIISDNYYDYSFRYTTSADSYTLDADPKLPLRTSYRFFRFRAVRTVSGGASGSSDVILFAPPQASGGSPATSAYKFFNPS